MTCKDGFTLPTELLNQVAETGLVFLPELIYCRHTIHARKPEILNILIRSIICHFELMMYDSTTKI